MRFSLALLLTALLTQSAFGGDPKVSGDVIGRELNIPGLGWVGHVGMWTGGNILEVLNDKKVIHDDSTLKAFKDKSAYWGAKWYDKTSNYKTVISTGRAQMDYSPEYTTGAAYRIGSIEETKVWNTKTKKWDVKKVVTNARFRCDTLVYYCFDKGISVKLAKATILPSIVYKTLPNTR